MDINFKEEEKDDDDDDIFECVYIDLNEELP